MGEDFMLPIFLLPVCGIVLAFLIARFLPKAKFRGYDILPFFFLPAVQFVSDYKAENSFLPYGFLFFFILVVIISCETVFKNKNIAVKKTMRKIWDYLTLCSLFWYLGMLFFLVL